MWSRAAKSFNISQISSSENNSTFMADLMSENSAQSSRPSHVILLPLNETKRERQISGAAESENRKQQIETTHSRQVLILRRVGQL